MIQIYHGDGKGKTTAAVGLAVRALGRKVPVVFAQFLKDGSSGEVSMLHKMGAIVMLPDTFFGFVRTMSDEQKERIKVVYANYLKEIQEVCSTLKKSSGEIEYMIVLDEVLHACNYGLLSEADLVAWINELPKSVEVVMTGRNPSGRLTNLADYCTLVQKEKHPYDEGVVAREGIEY